MQQEKPKTRFWLGNGVLAVALVLLLNMGTLWDRYGVVAMVLWALVACLGAYLLMSDKEPPQGPL